MAKAKNKKTTTGAGTSGMCGYPTSLQYDVPCYWPVPDYYYLDNDQADAWCAGNDPEYNYCCCAVI